MIPKIISLTSYETLKMSFLDKPIGSYNVNPTPPIYTHSFFSFELCKPNLKIASCDNYNPMDQIQFVPFVFHGPDFRKEG